MTTDLLPFAISVGHYRLWRLRVAGLVLGVPILSSSNAGEKSAADSFVVAATDASAASGKPKDLRLWMTVGDRRFEVTLSDTAAARAFAAQLPLTLDMAELNGNEKHAHLQQALPTNASRPGTISNGDLMLYGSDTLVVFYSTFDSSYSYTRLGRVNEPAGLAQALGRGSIRILFSSQ